MNNRIKKVLKKNELYVFLVIVLLGTVIQARSGMFFTMANFCDLSRAAMYTVLMALGQYLVIVSGGLDVSFPAIAALAMYVPMKYIVIDPNYSGSMIFPFLVAMVLGALMGMLNGYLIGKLNITPLIVTLGTCSIYRGLMMGGLNAQVYTWVPDVVKELSETNLFIYYSEKTGMTSRMSALIIIPIVFIFITYFITKYTRLGRGIFAVGGSLVAAKRAGFNTTGIYMFVYAYCGMLSALAAMIRTVLLTTVQPASFNTIDMTIISMVVIGGAAIGGGVGTMLGTLLGCVLITIITNSLILIGIPAYWQSFFSGLIIIIGTGIVAYQALMQKNKPQELIQDKTVDERQV